MGTDAVEVTGEAINKVWMARHGSGMVVLKVEGDKITAIEHPTDRGAVLVLNKWGAESIVRLTGEGDPYLEVIAHPCGMMSLTLLHDPGTAAVAVAWERKGKVSDLVPSKTGEQR